VCLVCWCSSRLSTRSVERRACGFSREIERQLNRISFHSYWQSGRDSDQCLDSGQEHRTSSAVVGKENLHRVVHAVDYPVQLETVFRHATADTNTVLSANTKSFRDLTSTKPALWSGTSSRSARRHAGCRRPTGRPSRHCTAASTRHDTRCSTSKTNVIRGFRHSLVQCTCCYYSLIYFLNTVQLRHPIGLFLDWIFEQNKHHYCKALRKNMASQLLNLDQGLVEQTNVLADLDENSQQVILALAVEVLEGNDVSEQLRSFCEQLGVNPTKINRLCTAVSALLWYVSFLPSLYDQTH
jgi:hypothetical protein